MLKDKLFNQTAQDKKIIDKNDFWLIENNPLTKIGVFPYLGRQISSELEPDKIYQVLRSKEELTKSETLKSLELIPLVDEHTMLGDKQGHEPAEKKGIHGVTGTNVNIDGDLITNDLKIYSETLKDEIKSGKKDLSLGYYCKYDVTPGDYNGIHYDAVQKDIIANHIALVEEGRMGKDVRVMDSITFDTLSDILKNKENNNMAEEKQTQDVDKRELIREVMAIAAKPNSDFEGGEEEKIETIAKKLETMSYNPSEAGGNDEDPEKEKKQEDEEPKKPCEDEDEDKRKLIDEIGGILNGKVDEEIIRTIMGKAEKLAYNNSEAGNGDEDPEEEKKENEDKPVSMDEAIKYLAKKDALVQKIKPYVGDNYKFPSMTIKEVVRYACDKLDIKNSLDTLEGYLKGKAGTIAHVTMDNALKSRKNGVIQRYLNDKKGE